MVRQYYEAYDDRYRQVHEKNLQWASDRPSPIVLQVMERRGITNESTILEIGCGEGRDATFLLKRGYHVTATDISPEAVRYCKTLNLDFSEHFRVLDCLKCRMDEKFDFIYAMAVVHMLVEDEHRAGFYRFIREHLRENAVGLVCTMGDGTIERKSDIGTAFDLQERTHGQSGEKLQLAATSCRMVSWDTFLSELKENGLSVIEYGQTAVEPDFPVMMYAVVR